MGSESRAYVLGPDQGRAFWFAGALMVTKASGEDSEGAFALLDQTVPGGYAAPRHVHKDEDEAWYLLDGEATFYCGDRSFSASRHSFVFLPKGVEHTFKVGPQRARMLTLSAPASFADFVEAAGEPAPELTLPPPSPPDPAALAEVAGRFGIEITGPPPS